MDVCPLFLSLSLSLSFLLFFNLLIDVPKHYPQPPFALNRFLRKPCIAQALGRQRLHGEAPMRRGRSRVRGPVSI